MRPMTTPSDPSVPYVPGRTEEPFTLAQLGRSTPPAPAPYPPANQLEQAIGYCIAAGWRVEGRTANVATMTSGQSTNHILHLLLTVFTAGAWLPIWLALAGFGGPKRLTIYMDAAGQVSYPKQHQQGISRTDVALRIAAVAVAAVIAILIVFAITR